MKAVALARASQHPPVEHAGWIVCRQETLFHCISVQLLTMVVNMVSYVLIIGWFFKNNFWVGYLFDFFLGSHRLTI
jgi:hypothetical protein